MGPDIDQHRLGIGFRAVPDDPDFPSIREHLLDKVEHLFYRRKAGHPCYVGHVVCGRFRRSDPVRVKNISEDNRYIFLSVGQPHSRLGAWCRERDDNINTPADEILND